MSQNADIENLRKTKLFHVRFFREEPPGVDFFAPGVRTFCCANREDFEVGEF